MFSCSAFMSAEMVKDQSEQTCEQQSPRLVGGAVGGAVCQCYSRQNSKSAKHRTKQMLLRTDLTSRACWETSPGQTHTHQTSLSP